MRTVELAKVAAAAEALRLRRIAYRQGMRAAFGAGAVVFVIAVFVLLHVLAYDLLIRQVTNVQTTLIMLAVDVVITGALGFMAMRNTPDAIETEAVQVRQQAVAEMKRSVTVLALASEVTGLVLRRGGPARPAGPRGSTRLLGEIAGRILSRRV